MKKKLLTTTLALAMLATTLTGCSLGKAKDPGTTSGEILEKGTEIQIGIEKKGYGDEFITKLGEAYEKKTGTKVVLVKSSSGDSWIDTQLPLGPEYNDIDIFFDIRDTVMRSVAVDNYVQGYDRALLDLSDLYNEVPEGYDTDKTLKELLDPYGLRSVTWDLEGEGYGDGKQYMVNYVTGLEGLMYNVTLFEKYNLSVPKTTTEFFALLDQIKTINNGSYAKNENGKEIYPYVFSGSVNYTTYLARVWWAQYDGKDAYDKVLEGKDAAGNYTPESIKSAGRLSALTHCAKLLAQDSGYYNLDAYGQSFTNAQVMFLDNQAFMTSTGDWIEREMSGNFENYSSEIAFMRIPVNSDIIQKCDSIKTEEQLVETIAYIDGESDTKPAYLSDADFARISEARSLYSSEGNQHVAYIPAYSNMAEESKDFLRFMLSKEGQEIMLQYSYGNMSPLNVDVTTMDGYDSLSSLQKSKYDMLLNGSGLSLIGLNKSHPMGYAGGALDFYSSMETTFGVVKTSKSYMSPVEFWEKDFKSVSDNWSTMMSNTGLDK